MRRFIFTLMIALLPLRGWMGEAMATEMATMHLIATQVTNTPVIVKFDDTNGILGTLEASANTATPSVGMSADCEIHAKSAPDTQPSKQLCRTIPATLSTASRRGGRCTNAAIKIMHAPSTHSTSNSKG